jgi:hypothetical protein
MEVVMNIDVLQQKLQGFDIYARPGARRDIQSLAQMLPDDANILYAGTVAEYFTVTKGRLLSALAGIESENGIMAITDDTIYYADARDFLLNDMIGQKNAVIPISELTRLCKLKEFALLAKDVTAIIETNQQKYTFTFRPFIGNPEANVDRLLTLLMQKTNLPVEPANMKDRAIRSKRSRR